MFYAILGLLIVILAVTIIFLPRKKPTKKGFNELSDEDFVKGARALGREFRVISSVPGVSIRPMVSDLDKAYALTSDKVKRDAVLTEGEKWYYENYYLIKRFVNSFDEKRISLLPGTGGRIRVVALCEYIVHNSIKSLSYERVKLALNAVNSEAPLTYAEIEAFKDALGFAITEAAYILSNRIIRFDEMESAGLAGKFRKDRTTSDIYLHFALKSKFSPLFYENIIKSGGTTESIEFNYSLSVVETTRLAEYIFISLKKLSEIADSEKMPALSVPDKMLSEGLSGYKYMSGATKAVYLKNIADIGEKINASEPFITRKLLIFSEYNKMDPLHILLGAKKEFIKFVRNSFYLKKVKLKSAVAKQRLYASAICLTGIAASVAVYFLTFSILGAILSFIPAFFAAECLYNVFLSASARGRTLPKMNFDKIPAEHSALIVISEYISSLKDAERAITHGETVAHANADKNLKTALLIDLRASDNPSACGDDEIYALIKKAAAETGLLFFIRKRVKNGKRYGAYERKRGAIMALCRFLNTGYKLDFSYISDDTVTGIPYIIALDSDNVTTVGGAKELINAIAHPANSRYDMIAARNRYNLYSLITPYAKRFAGDSALENYPDYSGLYFNLFGKDIFTGKGIFRVKNFYAKLEGVFPDNKILSHDIIEGAVLNTAAGSVVYEDAPKSFIVDRERRKRWARGDIQLLPFIGSHWKNRENEKYKSEIEPFYKYIIARNFLSLILPVFLLSLGVLSFFVNNFYFVAAFFAFFTCFISIISAVRRGITDNLRPRYVIKRISRAIADTVTEIGLLPYYALSNLVLIVTTFFKMAFGGNLLEWKTYSMSQSEGGKYWRELAPSALIVPVVSALFMVFGINALPALIYGIISYAVYAAMYISGMPQKKSNAFSREKYEEYAERIYSYFRFMRVSDKLICDNLQIKPYRGGSKTTSPTNIGFQLLSELSGYLLGFSSRREFIEIISEILLQIEKLDKWQGNLYNWYYCDTFTPVNKYVSSVDSGNLLAAMIIISEALKKEKEFSLALRFTKIIDETQLDALYDKEKRLLYIGYSEFSDRYDGHYDLLASEARLASLLYIARTGDAGHWRALTRDFTPARGNTLLSWSGTVFEYLMPEIFIKAPEGSLLNHSVISASYIQAKRKVRGVFGRSESGFYAYDEKLNYQYRAFGVDELSLGRESDYAVISPYSTFLMSEIMPDAALKNLASLEKIGAYGEYGFYEAADMEGRTRLIKSFMTHHQGMALASITNLLTDGALRKLMQNNPGIRAIGILLTETVPEVKIERLKVINVGKVLKSEVKYYKFIDNIEYSTAGAGLTDGTVSLYFDARGGGFHAAHNILVNRFIKGEEEQSGRHFYLSRDGKNYFSPTYMTFKKNPDDYAFSYSADEVTYTNKRENVELKIALDSRLSSEIMRLHVANGAGCDIAFYEPLALSMYDAQNAHPVFSGLFNITELIENKNAVIAGRKTREGEKPLYAGLVVFGIENIEFETNRFNFIGRKGSPSAPLAFTKKEKVEISFGEVLSACFAFKGKLVSDFAEVVIVTAESKEELLKKIDLIPDDYYGFAKEAGKGIGVSELTDAVLFEMISGRYPNGLIGKAAENGLKHEFYAAASSKPILYRYDGDESAQGLECVVKTVAELRLFGVNTRLIVESEKNDAALADKVKAVSAANGVFDSVTISSNDKAGISPCLYAFITLDKNLKVPDAVYYLKLPEETAVRTAASYFDYDFAIKSGYGGILDGEYLLPANKLTGLPYSNVVCGERGGFVATENGGGVYYLENSHENRVTRFDNDPVEDRCFEGVYLNRNGLTYRLNGGAFTDCVIYKKGGIEYQSLVDGIKFVTEVFIVKDGAAKIIEVSFEQNLTDDLDFIYGAEITLSPALFNPFILAVREENSALFENLANGRTARFKFIGSNIAESIIDARSGKLCAKVRVKPGAKLYIALGAAEIVEKLTAENIGELKKESFAMFESISKMKISTNNDTLDELYNNWIYYQIVSSRLNGKCGYYQLGGATGFRDQLQDVLSLTDFYPEKVKKQIILSASRQYAEGDVMHWWHEPAYGLRTKISDDKLFLPYAVCEYIKVTGDKGILEEKIPFLNSPPLKENEKTRFEKGEIGEEATLDVHCRKAIKSALKYGEHGLLLLGGGDWNDGLDAIGEKGRGESVFVTMFAAMVADGYAAIVNDAETAEKLRLLSAGLRKSVDDFAYDKEKYMRLFGDDGKWYGGGGSEAMEVDIISQSFAVFSGCGDRERQESALKSAEKLIDENVGIIKLISPPLGADNYLGYISAYPKGVRENGGQYTHGAVWYIKALIEFGRYADAYKLINMINPLEKCRNSDKNLAYKGEPFVLSGDVYSGAHPGRMGWSWYTGSAAWFARVIKEDLLGIKKRGKKLYIEPRLPIGFGKVKIDYDGIDISLVPGEVYELTADGIIQRDKKYIEIGAGYKTVKVIYKVNL